MINSITNEDDLVREYSKKVLIISRKFFLLGGDYDDLYQEGMIGLINAFRTFNPNLGIKFSTYAEKCIKNRIIDIIKSIGYSEFTSLDEFEIDDSISSVSPEEVMINNEKYNDTINKFKSKLSKYEFNVLKLYLNGYSYAEIADFVEKDQNSIYNAIQRVRHKLSDHQFV